MYLPPQSPPPVMQRIPQYKHGHRYMQDHYQELIAKIVEHQEQLVGQVTRLINQDKNIPRHLEWVLDRITTPYM